MPPHNWLIRGIESLHQGSNGIMRVLSIKISKGMIWRVFATTSEWCIQCSDVKVLCWFMVIIYKLLKNINKLTFCDYVVISYVASYSFQYGESLKVFGVFVFVMFTVWIFLSLRWSFLKNIEVLSMSKNCFPLFTLFSSNT